MAPSPPEIHVLGAGPTGALTALALGLRGQRVVLFDPLTASEFKPEVGRTPSLQPQVVDKPDLWHDLRDALVPFRELDLRDGATNARVLFSEDDLASANRHHDGIGWILDHWPLMKLLLARLEANGTWPCTWPNHALIPLTP